MLERTAPLDRYWSVVEPDGSVAIPPELLAELGVAEGGVIAIDVVDGCMVLRRHEPAPDQSPD